MIEDAKTQTGSTTAVRHRFVRLEALREQTRVDHAANELEIKQLDDYLAIAAKVTGALEQLSDQLFRETLTMIEDKLSIALQEILEHPIRLVAEPSWKNNAAAVDFYIERDGHREDILKGQGGSVANIVSIGLRMFALASLDPDEHRPFLVFDEQDCWLQPQLVPRLVKIVRDAGRAIGFQVLMISHHNREIFEQYADRIYELNLGPKGAETELVLDRDGE